MSENVRIRPADADERPAVANVIDGADLAIDDDRLLAALDAGDALVADAADIEREAADARSDGDDGKSGTTDARIVGALVLDDEEVVAVAVRRKRRDQGIGRALVEAAAERRDRLVAECHADVRPFWASLGFEVGPTPEDRFVCVR